MDTLIAELERATEGSRELDAKIAMALYPTLATFRDDPERGTGHWISDKAGPVFALDYTTSLDAALTLVSEGWSLANLYDAVDPKDRPWVGVILRRDEPRYKLPEKVLGAPTYAMALCIAALKARQAMKGTA